MVLITMLLIIPMVNFQHTGAQTLQRPQKLSEYVSTINGIKMNYPSNWLKKDSGLPTSNEGPENKTIVAFIPPESGIIFRVSMDRLPNNSTLKDVVREELKGISEVAKLQGNVTILESNSTSLSHHPAHKMLYGFSQKYLTDYIPMRAMVIVTVVNHTKFAISYAGVVDQFLSGIRLANSMIDSLQIVKPAGR
jgi:hypothetical protein